MAIRFLFRLRRSIMTLLPAGAAMAAAFAFKEYGSGLHGVAIDGIDLSIMAFAVPVFCVLGLAIAGNLRRCRQLRRELRHNRRMLEQTQRIAQIGSWEFDPANNHWTWSDEACRIFEIAPASCTVSRAAFLNAIHPDDRDRVIAACDDARENGSSRVVDYRLLFPDGRVRDIRERYEPWFDANANRYRLLGAVQDITEVKLAEAMLENEKARLRTFIDTIPDLVWIKDTEGVYLACNPVFESFFGATEADIAGKTDHAFVDPGLAAFSRQQDMDAIVSERPCVNEEWVTFACDGRRALLETIKTPFRDDQGRIAGVLGIGRDITERKRMADALHRREQEFRTIAENSPDVIARYDRDGRYLYANPALQKLAGIPGDAFLGRTQLELTQGKISFQAFEEKRKEAQETGRETEVELIEDSIEGIFRPLCEHIRFTPEFGSDGTVVSVLAIGRNIGQLKAAERYLRRSRALLQTLAAREEKAREQERKRVAWDMHEELGQNLVALRINFQLLNDRLGNDAAWLQERLESSKELLDCSIRVVRDVAAALRPSVLDLGIDVALEWLAEKFMEKNGIQTKLRLGEQGIVLNDEYATAIFRIVQEALDNVSRHAQATAVEIALERREIEYLLEVRDDGKGFDLDTPKEKTLGLVGIQERARRLHGKVAIFSAPGAGTVIEVRIPVHAISASDT